MKPRAGWVQRTGLLLLGLTVLAGCASPAGSAETPPVTPFRGLGTWVDVYDYGPAFQGDGGGTAPVTVASIDDMAGLGVKTLYLQAAQDDDRSDGLIVDRELVGRMLERAHANDMSVVAWYLPHFADVDRDLRHIRALSRFDSGGERFDGIALDIEWTSDVSDTTNRNAALIELSRRARAEVDDVPLGAIVLEPVLIEDVNEQYWPAFPWKRIAPNYDVWLPMSYWTNRTESSGWNDGARYTAENVQRVRANLGDPEAAVHPIGGVGDTATLGDYEGFVRAAKRSNSVGWSIYDYATTSSAAWAHLRG